MAERVRQVDTPVLVLESLQYIRENMDYGAFMNRRLHGWAFAKLHAQIQYKAEEAGVPVATVNPRNTSTECHACGEEGTRPEQATFRCPTDKCWVSEYQADVNAALNIADRYRGGENPKLTGIPGRRRLVMTRPRMGWFERAELSRHHERRAAPFERPL